MKKPTKYRPLNYGPKARMLDAATWVFTGSLALLMALGWSAESTVHGMWTAMGSPPPPLWIRMRRRSP